MRGAGGFVALRSMRDRRAVFSFGVSLYGAATAFPASVALAIFPAMGSFSCGWGCLRDVTWALTPRDTGRSCRWVLRAGSGPWWPPRHGRAWLARGGWARRDPGCGWRGHDAARAPMLAMIA